jgi:copper homeostasis protein
MLTPNRRGREEAAAIPPPPPLVEAAVDTLDAAVEAVRAGADRLELCDRLDLGGLTPNEALVGAVLARVGVPVMVMIRSRPGDFAYSAGEVATMEDEIRRMQAAGATGFVLGAITGGDRLDDAGLGRLMRAAGGTPVTFHRAFDRLREPEPAMVTLGELGVRRVLTSGRAARAWDGRDAIRRLVERAPPGLGVLAGGGIRGDHVAELVRQTGVREVHLAASRRATKPGARCASEPDPERLRAVLAALTV